MISDEFTKFDGVRGVSLDDVFGTPDVNEDATTGLVREYLEELAASAHPYELEGYWPYKLFTADRHYYPRQDTLRVLPTGWVVFVDDLTSEPGDRPIYRTLQHTLVESIIWLPKEEEEVQADVLPIAA